MKKNKIRFTNIKHVPTVNAVLKDKKLLDQYYERFKKEQDRINNIRLKIKGSTASAMDDVSYYIDSKKKFTRALRQEVMAQQGFGVYRHKIIDINTFNIDLLRDRIYEQTKNQDKALYNNMKKANLINKNITFEEFSANSIYFVEQAKQDPLHKAYVEVAAQYSNLPLHELEEMNNFQLRSLVMQAATNEEELNRLLKEIDNARKRVNALIVAAWYAS